jgi:hypothetical protein
MSRIWQRIFFAITFSLAASGCATFAEDQRNLLHSSSQPWVCEGKIEVNHFGGGSQTAEYKAKAIVYPSKDIENLEIDLTPAMSQAKKLCTNGATCQVKQVGAITQIAIQPAKPTHPSSEVSPGMMFYSESLKFDPASSQLDFGGGGFEWNWGFTGKCIIKP